MATQTANRRSFLKWAAAAPLLSQIAARNLYAQAASVIGKDPRQNVYTRLWLKTIINCRGTWTYLSGSLEFPEVRLAEVEAAQYFVNMIDLQHAAGRKLAELTGAESGHGHFRERRAQWPRPPPDVWLAPMTNPYGNSPIRPA